MPRKAKHTQTAHAFLLLCILLKGVHDMKRAPRIRLDFTRLGRRTTSASTKRHVSACKTNATQQDCAAERLPPELLGAAFEYLTLPDRIRASHVSQHWRAAALATPQLWATIHMTCSSDTDVDFATTLLSRSGSITDVRIMIDYPDTDSDGLSRADRELDTQGIAFNIVIRPYLHKIRSLDWRSHVPVRFLRDAAPFLERLHVSGLLLDLDPDFLAGGSGVLRSLRCQYTQLPVTCPALSSVVDLRIETVKVDPALGLPRLFGLCPRLETVYLGGLRNKTSHMLLAGPPPACLRSLTLRSRDPEWQPMRHFVCLHTADVRVFSLDCSTSRRTTIGPIPELFLRGATALHIREPILARGSWFVVTLPGLRERSLALPELCVRRLARHIVTLGAAHLQSIQMLDVTIDLLEHFVPVVHALPALETMTIHLETIGSSGTPRHPDVELVGLEALAYAQAVLDAAPQLRSLVLMVHRPRDSSRATICLQDAEFILSHLQFLGARPAPVPQITVCGFTDEAVRDLDPNVLPVRFDTAYGVDGPAYWPFKVAYNDP